MNERRKAPSHSIPALFVFLLLGIFALFSLVLIVFGAQAYRNTIEYTAAHNRERILSAFIRNNLRTSDVVDAVCFLKEEEVPRLVLNDPEDDEYVKYIYVYDGQLCELYTEVENEFNAEAGEIICAADSIDVRMDGSVMEVVVKAGESEHVTIFSLRCEEDRT